MWRLVGFVAVEVETVAVEAKDGRTADLPNN
jgi:hypothetical protein